MNEASVGAFAVTAVLGYLVVFIGLILLMIAIIVMGRIMKSRSAARPAAQTAAPLPAPAPAAPPAPGTAGELKLYNTDDRTAAMLMAIVADELDTPLNELRFKSIKEVTSDEV